MSLQQQGEKIWHLSNIMTNEPALKLAQQPATWLLPSQLGVNIVPRHSPLLVQAGWGSTELDLFPRVLIFSVVFFH